MFVSVLVVFFPLWCSLIGTWSTELKADASALQVVPKDMPLEFAAGLASPCAAYRMLNDFVSLKEGKRQYSLSFNFYFIYFRFVCMTSI